MKIFVIIILPNDDFVAPDEVSKFRTNTRDWIKGSEKIVIVIGLKRFLLLHSIWICRTIGLERNVECECRKFQV